MKKILYVVIISAIAATTWLAVDSMQRQHAKMITNGKLMTDKTIGSNNVSATEIVAAIRSEMTQMILYERYQNIKRSLCFPWLIGILIAWNLDTWRRYIERKGEPIVGGDGKPASQR